MPVFKQSQAFYLLLAFSSSSADAFSISYYTNQRNSYLSSSNNDHETKSIGEVVKNLHGGKYQFHDSYLAGSTRIGQEFADSLYASDGSDTVDDEEEEIPKWALRLMDPINHKGKPVQDTLYFSRKRADHEIKITNDERSWEKFYASIFSLDQVFGIEDGGNCPFEICPQSGTLAPRGGASNACDVNDPYSDSALIVIKWDEEQCCDVDAFLLVLGTEAEVWRYLLKTT